MMLRVRGKVERREKIDPDIVSRNSVADNPNSTLPHHSKLLDHQTLWIGVWNDDAGLTANPNPNAIFLGPDFLTS